MSEKIRDYVIGYVILAKVFSKRYTNNFSRKADKYFKEKTVICKSYRYKALKRLMIFL